MRKQTILQPILMAGVLSLGVAAASAASWQPTALSTPSTIQDKKVDVVGQAAPEPSAGTWFNSIGQAPSRASLQGKVWVVEMWATW